MPTHAAPAPLRRHWLKFLAAGAALPLAGCDLRYWLFGFPQPEVTTRWPASGVIELPFRAGPGGLVLVRGRVNDRAEVDFILDTGAPVSLLLNGPDATRALALDTRNARKLGPSDNPASPVGVIAPDFTFDFGAVRLAGLSVVVMDDAQLPCPERFKAIDFSGVIGADLFKRFRIEVDHGAQRVRLHPPGAWQPGAQAARLPLHFHDGHVYIDAGLRLQNGGRGEAVAPLRLHLDTGKSTGLALIAGSRPELVMPAEGAVQRACLVAGTLESRVGAPVELEFGALRTTIAAPLYEAPNRLLAAHRHGAIGIEVLSRYRFTVDYPGRQLVLQARTA